MVQLIQCLCESDAMNQKNGRRLERSVCVMIFRTQENHFRNHLQDRKFR